MNNSSPLLVPLQSAIQMLLTEMHKNYPLLIRHTFLLTFGSCCCNPEEYRFQADYLALKDFFINKICVLRNEVISSKQYVDQILADANISSRTSKLIAKIELLEKENMELREIVINKEIIVQNLSSNKNITKEIPKIDKMDCPTHKGEEYPFCESVTECQNPPKEYIHQKKFLNRLTKTKITSTSN